MNTKKSLNKLLQPANQYSLMITWHWRQISKDVKVILWSNHGNTDNKPLLIVARWSSAVINHDHDFDVFPAHHVWWNAWLTSARLSSQALHACRRWETEFHETRRQSCNVTFRLLQLHLLQTYKSWYSDCRMQNLKHFMQFSFVIYFNKTFFQDLVSMHKQIIIKKEQNQTTY